MVPRVFAALRGSQSLTVQAFVDPTIEITFVTGVQAGYFGPRRGNYLRKP